MHRVASTGNTGTAGRARKERRLTFICRDSDEAKHCSGVNALQLAADWSGAADIRFDNVLFSGSRDGTIKRWDLKGGQVKCAATLESHVDWVNDLVLFNEDVLVSCSSDTTIKVWRGLSSGECVKTFRQHRDYVTALAPARKTNFVASGGLRNEIFVWDLEAGLPIARPPADAAHPLPTHVPGALSVPGRPTHPAQGSAASVPSNGSSAAPEAGSAYRPLEVVGSKDSVYALAMNDSATLLVAGGTEKVLRVWDPRSGSKQWKLRGHTDNVKSILMDPTGRYCLSGSSDAIIRLWDVGQQRCVTSYAVHTDSVWAMAANPSFKTLYSGGRDGCLYRTDVDSKESVLLAADQPPVLALALQGGEQSLWVGSVASSISRWHAKERVGEKESVHATRFVAGSLSLARVRSSADASTAPVPLYNEAAVVVLGSPGIVQHCVLNDRRHVLTNDSEGTVKLWEVTSGRVVENFGKVNFEEKEKEIFEKLSVPAWFTTDTRLGSLAVHLETPHCFSAEMYATDLHVEGVGEDKKLNLGLYTICGLFSPWYHKRRALDEAHALSIATPPPSSTNGSPAHRQLPEDSAQAAVVGGGGEEGAGDDGPIRGLPSFTFSPHPPVSILTEGSHSGPWRKTALELSGEEGSREIPWWCIEAVMHHRMPPREPAKCSFFILPQNGSDLQTLSQGKLSAPRILRIQKVLNYVSEKLGMDRGAEATPPHDPAATNGSTMGNGNSVQKPPPPTESVQILCNDEVLSPEMSLATVRAYVWKRPGDLELCYRIKKAGEAA